MKKYIFISFVLVIIVFAGLILFYSCDSGESEIAPTPTPTQTPQPEPTPEQTPEPTPNVHNNLPNPHLPVSSDNWPENLPRHEPGSIILHEEHEFEGLIDTTNPMQFRMIFYTVSAEFVDLVGNRDITGPWFDNVGEDYLYEMTLANFVEYFNIPKEDFIRVVEQKQSVMILGDSEWDELPNADIIYTFDMDIIRYFYRRE